MKLPKGLKKQIRRWVGRLAEYGANTIVCLAALAVVALALLIVYRSQKP